MERPNKNREFGDSSMHRMPGTTDTLCKEGGVSPSGMGLPARVTGRKDEMAAALVTAASIRPKEWKTERRPVKENLYFLNVITIFKRKQDIDSKSEKITVTGSLRALMLSFIGRYVGCKRLDGTGNVCIESKTLIKLLDK